MFLLHLGACQACPKFKRAAGIAGALGAVLPDAPAFVGTAYYLTHYSGEPGFVPRRILEKIYFRGPFGTTGSALHSVIPVVVLLGIYWALKPGRADRRGVLLWFLLGWIGHTTTCTRIGRAPSPTTTRHTKGSS